MPKSASLHQFFAFHHSHVIFAFRSFRHVSELSLQSISLEMLYHKIPSFSPLPHRYSIESQAWVCENKRFVYCHPTTCIYWPSILQHLVVLFLSILQKALTSYTSSSSSTSLKIRDTISERWLTNEKCACSHFPCGFWSSYEYLHCQSEDVFHHK